MNKRVRIEIYKTSEISEIELEKSIKLTFFTQLGRYLIAGERNPKDACAVWADTQGRKGETEKQNIEMEEKIENVIKKEMNGNGI